jgi:hypothetical protein
MMEQTIRKGVIELDPPAVKPRQRDRFGSWRPGEEGKSPCHYCLESLPRLEEEGSELRACPICRHKILENLLGIPVHLFNRPQQWELLANELEYIWNWNYEIIKNYRNYFNLYLHAYRTEEYSEAKVSFENLNDSKFLVLSLREEFMEAEGELDILIAAYLEKVSKRRGYEKWHNWGSLDEFLIRGRSWRERAKDLSREGAAKREITEFQLEMVRATSWGAFGSMAEKNKILSLVELRLIQS